MRDGRRASAAVGKVEVVCRERDLRRQGRVELASESVHHVYLEPFYGSGCMV